ncbi:hypothetical protein CVT24_002898 [Panaeolus cyanescens]|uniref:Uncharacterized protein n=1 Tax=Panaeolus cyanescens TaxID=181874 RepID=A0A409YXW5_9AGAR|nr:hypothetical protein CVT24_002898 [Panaeolus cyanescens]
MPTLGPNNTANRAGNRTAGNLGRPPQTAQNTRNASLGAQSDRNTSRQTTPAYRDSSPPRNANTFEVTDVKTAMTLLNREGICRPDEIPDLFALGEALFNVASTDQANNGVGQLKAIALILQDMTIQEATRTNDANTTGGGMTEEALKETLSTLKEDWDTMRESLEEKVEAMIEEGNKRLEQRLKEMLDEHRREEKEAREEVLNRIPRTYARAVGEGEGEKTVGRRGGMETQRGATTNSEQPTNGGGPRVNKFAKRQVMIEKASGFNTWSLYELTDAAIILKVNIALNNARKELKSGPPAARFIAVRKMPRGGVLLTTENEEAAEWVKSEGRSSFLKNLGCTTTIAERGYRVAVDYVPVSTRPEAQEERRRMEERNKLAQGAIIDARWMKDPTRRRVGQEVATMQVTLRRARQANKIIKLGLKFNDKVGEGRRVEVIPCVCFNCQEIDAKHIATNCPNETTCLGCGGDHNHRMCGNYDRNTYYCKNCDMTGDHGPGSKNCPRYQDARARIEARIPGNGNEYYDETGDEEEEEEAREDEWMTEGQEEDTWGGPQEGITATGPIDKQWRKKEKRKERREKKKAEGGNAGGSSTEETDDEEEGETSSNGEEGRTGGGRGGKPQGKTPKSFSQMTLTNNVGLQNARGGSSGGLGGFDWATEADRQQKDTDALRYGTRGTGAADDNYSNNGSEEQ